MPRLVLTTLAWFALLILLNASHLGANAALHWDAVDAIATADPMPTAAQLADARRHVFDLAAEARSDDPAVVTAYFMSPAAAGRHGPIETVRRYYSQAQYTLARAAFAAGGRLTGSATGGVLATELVAAAMVATAMGLLTYKASPLALLAAVAVGTTPVFLSISRQILTETIALALLVPGLLLARASVRRPWAAAPAGLVLFLTVRARYNLAPEIALLLPLVWLTRPGPIRRPLLIGVATFAACVAADAAVYGPLFSPLVYIDALVRSTRLYFHADPPYDAFWTALFVNAPLLLLPPLAIVAARPTRVTLYAAAVLVTLTIPMAMTAAQHVRYQPRHLFPFAATAAVTLLLTLPHIRWRPGAAAVFAAACTLTIAANVYSTFGPQRTTMRTPWPPTIARNLRHRWTTPGPHPPWPITLLNSYFDWSDNRRLHDQLLTLDHVRHVPGRPLLVVSGGVDGSGFYCRWATQFGPHAIWWPPVGHGDTATIDAALAAGRPVYAVLPIGGTLPPFATTPVPLNLDQAVLVRLR